MRHDRVLSLVFVGLVADGVCVARVPWASVECYLLSLLARMLMVFLLLGCHVPRLSTISCLCWLGC